MKFQQVYFVLDAKFRLLWLGGDWEGFALANGGTTALSDDVLATSLLDHIVDEATRDAMIGLIEAVLETQDVLRIDYRCDSNIMLRRYQLTIQPMKDKRVLLVHDLRHAQSFSEPLGVWKNDQAAPARKCSFCCSVSGPSGQWLPPEQLSSPHPPDVAFTICPNCDNRVQESIAALRAKRKPKIAVTGGYGP